MFDMGPCATVTSSAGEVCPIAVLVTEHDTSTAAMPFTTRSIDPPSRFLFITAAIVGS
jgi:hypothetical protein